MVLLEQRDGLGLATLDRPLALNSLNVEMVTLLLEAIEKWQTDREVFAIVLRGNGPKAFCAGGDVKTVCLRLREGDKAYAETFFATEYRVDHAIHTSKKPVIVLGHGLVMGGGVGLMAGATARVVTDSTVVAMPEISIGFFPDVGGSYFLNRAPGKLGLYLALTGARINASDAIYAGLADAFVPDAQLENLLALLARSEWDDSPELNKIRVRRTIAEHSVRFAADAPKGQLPKIREQIDAALSGDDPAQAFARLATLDVPGIDTFKHGSPTSAHLIYEQLRRGRGIALREAFRMELNMAIQACRHHDFPEGVRALLIDKDQKPHWNPAHLADVPRSLIEEHFASPWYGQPHPLLNLI